jgi:beta-1,4-mannosyl-glycoprotein beta-1,4-N-acetylglucosaminyltransferase
MKVFDCFKFFNELELLHLRFMEYYDVVDYFVLVESTKSHTGKDKELIFKNNKHLFEEYLDKVIHVVVEDLPDYNVDDIWNAENFQRNCIIRGLYDVAELGDKIIVSDCDEFWDVDVFEANKNRVEPFTFMQDLFYYWVNCQQNHTWGGSCCATYGTFQFPQQLRDFGRGCQNGIYPGGWHYSFMGGADRIKTKVENIAESHMIINEVGDVDQIQDRMEKVEDLWGRTDDIAKKQMIELTYKPKSLDKFIELYPVFYREL